MSCGLKGAAGSLRRNFLFLSIYLSIYLSIPKYDCIDSCLTELFSFDRSKHALAEDVRKNLHGGM